jgi:phosphoglycerate dehydrogenase-like enzyme
MPRRSPGTGRSAGLGSLGEVNEPLVWLPFPPEDLGEPPAGLRYELVRPERDGLPDSAADVRFYVPSYQLGRVEPDLFDHLPSLEVVQTMTAGVDHIRAAMPEGVLLCNGRGIHDASTAELALTLTLASLRGIPQFVRAQDQHRWAPERRESLADKSVLIVGHGQIGAAIEARLRPFEVAEVVRVARHAREGVHEVARLPDLLPAADVVVVIVPGTADTRRLVDRRFLAAMKDGALLVNLSRGTVVDQDALVETLQSCRISAALDVTDPEPLPEDHPLWSAPNLLLSPHVGGASSAMWPRAHKLVREQLGRYAAGEPLLNQMTGDY